ncbi:DUF4253 domain-containing protein [Micromonospora sp. DT228]|uniref:DUF4253 domain-containing protein n=1 Tax=Micromonospora sp. DT228 TaxID=3393443 RepID=UPI003CF3BFA3
MTELMTTPRLIATALRGTALAGHPVEEGLGGTILVGDVDPTRLREAWQAAHSVLPVTGRWPVFTLPGGLDHEPDAAEIDELDRASRTVDPWSVYRRYVDEEPLDRKRVEYSVRAAPGDEFVATALDQLGDTITAAALDRWTYDALLADPSLAARAARYHENLAGVGSWHTFDRVQLVLLPTASQWLAPAWVGYHGAGGDGWDAAWAAAMREWDQRWGAGLVAAWGTMLQFVVDRPPRPGQQAWELAGQLLAVGGSLQYQQWQLALAVAGSDAWFLHDRP